LIVYLYAKIVLFFNVRKKKLKKFSKKVKINICETVAVFFQCVDSVDENATDATDATNATKTFSFSRVKRAGMRGNY